MKRRTIWLVAAMTPLAACSSNEEQAVEQAQTFHEIMKDEIDLRADAVWEVGNAAINDQASIDPAKMTDADWDKLAKGASSLRDAALKIAALDPMILTRPGVTIADEGIPGGHSSATVQARFDKNPETLRDMANVLAVHVGDLATAARDHDAVRAGLLVNQLDGVCENCHLQFWYPDQKALVEAILAKDK